MRHSSHMPPAFRQGYILLLAIVFLGIFFAIAAAYANLATSTVRSSRADVTHAQARALAEAGVDQAIYQLNHNAAYAGETNTALAPGMFTVAVSSIDETTKQVTATGFVPDSVHPLASETVHVQVGINASIVSFRYGVQAGAGGFTLSGGAQIDGNVYANGNINATTGVHITGSATAANPPALSTDQANDVPDTIPSCSIDTCITFADSSATQDVAQSFQISTAVGLNAIQFYIKKVGTPSDAVVKITTDSGGVPGSTLMSGTLPASSVTTNFGWVSVPMPATPILSPGQTYWMVIDASSNASKYYILGANADGYAAGTAKVGKYGGSWSATVPPNLDGYFKIFLGGGTSLIGGNTYTTGVYIGTTGSDDAWAHTIKGATVSGTPYCVDGSYLNKPCDTSRPDPTPQPMPVSDGNIALWEDEATAGGTTTGDVHVGWAGATLGPKKIVGNLVVDGGGTLTVAGTLYVTGTITVTGGARVVLAASYGPNDGLIISDGTITINGGSSFAGSGASGSYPFLITTSACPAGTGCNGASAISLSGGAGTIALIAPHGTAIIQGGTALKEVTANEIVMGGGAHLTYDSGLISPTFTSGPGGSWTVIPHTYSITN